MSVWYPCVYCTEDLKCAKYSDDEVTSYCLLGPCHDETKSNADRIRGMSDEKLAEWILREPFAGFFSVCPPGTIEGADCPTSPCEQCWLDWLKSPVEEVDNGT